MNYPGIIQFGQRYLQRYNYTSDNAKTTLGDTLLRFQTFAGIPVTGQLDNETIRMMKMPRCGNSDHQTPSLRVKRYALQGSKWQTTHLTYRVRQYSRRSQLSPGQIDQEIARAFFIWSQVTQLRFTKWLGNNINVAPDIEISFEVGEHGDGYPFDNKRGGVLAHAYFPPHGDIHFDDDEHWTSGTSSGTNFLQVVAHEIGHSLGLWHSDVPASLMAPFYRGFKPEFQLHQDDIDGIQRLYGVEVAPDAEFDPDPDSLCRNPQDIDVIFSDDDGVTTWVLKGEKYWEIDDRGILPGGYPKPLQENWPGLPGHLDAAFVWFRRTYFFKGEWYWRYRQDKSLDKGYPRRIRGSRGFKGIPGNIDTAFVRPEDRKVYFFKDGLVYEFDLRTMPPRKPITEFWLGLGRIDFDGAFTRFGKTHVFKGDRYWRLERIRDDGRWQSYPGLISEWFGCENSPGNQENLDPESEPSTASSAATVVVAAVIGSVLLLISILGCWVRFRNRATFSSAQS